MINFKKQTHMPKKTMLQTWANCILEKWKKIITIYEIVNLCVQSSKRVISDNQGLKAKMWAFEKNGSNLKAKMFLDNNISIYQVHQTWGSGSNLKAKKLKANNMSIWQVH